MLHDQVGNGSVGRHEFLLYSSFHFLGNKGESRPCRSRIHVLTLSCVCRWSGCKTKIVANSDFVLNGVLWCLCHGIFVSCVNFVTGTLCRLSWHTWRTVSWQLFWIVMICDWVCELCWSLCFFGVFFLLEEQGRLRQRKLRKLCLDTSWCQPILSRPRSRML